MYAQLFSSHLSQPIIIILLILLVLPKYHAQDYDHYYSQCLETFNCGESIRNISYPFWGGSRPSHCGLEGLKLSCKNNDYPTIDIDSWTFRVIGINQYTQEIRIARDDFQDNVCPPLLTSNSLNETLFGYNRGTEVIHVFYDCPSGLKIELPAGSIWNNFTCMNNGVDSIGYYVDESFTPVQRQTFQQCRNETVVLVLRTAFEEFRNNESMTKVELLKKGFLLNYKIDDVACSACVNSSGACASKEDSKQFTCLCGDRAYSVSCPSQVTAKNHLGLKIGIGISAGGTLIAFMFLAFLIYNRRKKTGSSFASRNISSYPSSMSDSEKGGTYLGVPIFSYSELEKATNNFDSKKELGDGGFGAVYQGKLQDGRVVAVKRLYESNFRRVEQFMNEIEILTRLRHQNLVSLYGCTSHHCRELLLVYEYIPNGTIADHLYGERAKPGSLTWKTRMSIAIETASALSYLHASEVIHRDVKTTNILLDNNFCVKVADFGLSRLFPFNATHVSTAPQGTPGYVDPEYHQCYQLTVKSDVYSFGVVLIELISSKPAVDITRHRHEINLSNMAINKIQNDALHELVDPCLGFESDYEVRKMITDVAELAFQCLQNDREFRPSMEEVLNALRGIQSNCYAIGNQKEVDLLADDASLLKNNPQILSPDSVTVKWGSKSTTSSSSSQVFV